MKPQKPYIPTDNSENEGNVASEPAMVYGYANQPHFEPATVENLNEVAARPQKILQPDDDLCRAITFDELLIGVKVDLREMFMKGK
jgi:hypothetical protein